MPSEKVRNLLSFQLWIKQYHFCFSWRMDLALNNPTWLICHYIYKAALQAIICALLWFKKIYFKTIRSFHHTHTRVHLYVCANLCLCGLVNLCLHVRVYIFIYACVYWQKFIFLICHVLYKHINLHELLRMHLREITTSRLYIVSYQEK